MTITKIGHLANGPSYDIVEHLGYVYAGQGSEIRIYDVRDKSKVSTITWRDYVSRIYVGDLVYSLRVDANYLYIAGNKLFVIADISDPLNPLVISTTNNPKSMAMGGDIEVSGNYAFISNYGYGIWVVDITNKSLPVTATTIALGSFNRPGRMKVSGNYLYVGTWTDYTFFVIDITNPRTPVLKGSWRPAAGVIKSLSGVDIVGNYAYVAEFHGPVYILNITDPMNPVLISTVSGVGGSGSSDIRVLGNYAYVSVKYLGVVIIDVSNPAAPAIVESFSTMSGYNEAVFPTPGYLYHSSITSGFSIIDTSVITAPVELTIVPVVGEAYSLGVKDNYMYIGCRNNGIWVVDISDPANPREAVFIYRKGRYETLRIDGNLMYTAGDWDGLAITDITDPLNPVVLLSRYGGNISAVLKDSKNNNAYCFVYILNGEYDITQTTTSPPINPANGTIHVSLYTYEGAPISNNIYIDASLKGAGNVTVEVPAGSHTVRAVSTATYPYPPKMTTVDVVAGETTEVKIYYGALDDMLAIDDVTNPSSPIRLTPRINTPIPVKGYFSNFERYGNYLLGCVYRGIKAPRGLYVIDVLDPYNPRVVTVFESGGLGYKDVKMIGSTAFGLTGNSIVAIDLSNPAAPVKIGELKYQGVWSGQAIDVHENIAYAVGKALKTFDISNPTAMKELDGIVLPATLANDLVYYGDKIFVSDNDVGVYILSSDINPPPVNTGTLVISTTPVNGAIYVDGVLKGVGTTSMFLLPGTYTVSFGTLEGFITPPNQNVTIAVGVITEIVGTYAPVTGSLSVTTTPAGASILIDNVPSGTTPATVPGIPIGIHTLKLTLAGYEDHIQNVTILEELTTTVSVTLTRIVGALSVTTTPPGASVYLDDILQGVAPTTITGVPIGNHTLKLTLAGYEENVRTVVIQKDLTTTVDAVLTPVPVVVGTLTIATIPVSGDIYIDSLLVGNGEVTKTVSAGIHVVSFGDVSGYITPLPQSIDVTPGSTIGVIGTYTVIPPPPTGTLVISTDPVPGNIFVDGELKGNGTVSLTLTPGQYSVIFGYVPGYISPAALTADVVTDMTTNVTGTYIPEEPLPQPSQAGLIVGAGAAVVAAIALLRSRR